MRVVTPSAGLTLAASSHFCSSSGPHLASGILAQFDVPGVGAVWGAPTSVIGLAYGLLGYAAGGSRPKLGNNGVEFENHAI
jgi:hypothetical protein